MTGSLKHSAEMRSDLPETDYQAEVSDHKGGQLMADGKSYEPGPSFVDNDRPEERLTEMPAWLQSFAAQEGHMGEDAASDDDTLPDLPANEPAYVEHDKSDSLLPDWLRSDTPEEPADFVVPQDSTLPDRVTSFVDDASNPDGFISEDDLPDWLRAFSEESPIARPSAPPVAVMASVPGTLSEGSAVVRVPPVENIWLSAYEKQALGPGGTLFALLASNNGSDTPRDYDTGTTTTYSAADTASQRSDPVASKQSSASSDKGLEEAHAAPSSSMRLILLTLLVVALVVAISFWQFS